MAKQQKFIHHSVLLFWPPTQGQIEVMFSNNDAKGANSEVTMQNEQTLQIRSENSGPSGKMTPEKTTANLDLPNGRQITPLI
jgi:hypothetical protein